MKTLYLVRHAKSSWEFNVDDHQRPLNNRGYKDAESVGLHLNSLHLSIDKVISSDSVRARTTAKIITDLMGIDPSKFNLESKLYDFSGGDVLDVIKSCDQTVNALMVFGHNHAFTTLANALGSVSIDNLPTTGVVAISFNNEHWSAIKKGETILTVFPKELRE